MVPVGLVAGNAILWGLRPGKYLAHGSHTVGKAFTKYIQPSIDRWLGDRPPLIEIIREPDDKKSNQHVFTIKNVEIIDHAAIQQKIKTETEKATIDIKERDKERDSTEIVPSSPSKEQKRGPFYEIKLTIAKQQEREISLGEIDFSNWEDRTDFTFTITRNDGNGAITVDKARDREEYTKVLKTLGILPKALANGKNHPTDGISKITESSWVPFSNWGKSFFFGKTVVQELAPDDPHPFLQGEIFVDHMAELVATDIARNPKSQIIENYFATTELSLENQINIAKKEQKKLELELAQREKNRKREKIISAAIIIGAVLLVAGIIVAAFFAPPSILVFIGFAVGKVFDFIKNSIIGSFYVLGAGALMAGLGMAYNDYQATRLEGTRQDLEETSKIIKDTTKDLDDLQKEKLGARSTLDSIMELRKSNTDTLDFSKKTNVMGAMGAKILRNFLSDPKLGLPSCKTLNLSKNSLEGEELAELAKSLGGSDISEQFQIQNIDITGNPIKDDFSVDGITNIKNALAKNFTVTEFKYDLPIFPGTFTKTTQTTFAKAQKSIAEETLVNLYLREGLTEKVKERLKLADLTENQLKTAAENKIKENFKATNIPHIPNTEISARIDRIIDQNKSFTQLNSLPEKPSPDKNYGKTYMDIFKKDPERCVMFTSQSDGLKEALRPQIQNDILQNIFALLTIKSSGDRKNLLAALFTTTGEKTKENTKANIETVITILNNLQTLGVSEVSPEIIKFLVDNKVFDGLATTNSVDFKKKLEAQKQKLLQHKIDYKLKDAVIKAFDLALHQELGPVNTTPFKKLQLEQLVTNQPKGSEFATFKEFLDIYSTIPENELGSVFKNIDLAKFMGLVNADIYYSKKEELYSQLRRNDLSEEHRRVLLEFYFSKDQRDANHPNKIKLITSILGNKEFTGLSFGKTTKNGATIRDTDLYYAFFGTGGLTGRNPQNFDQLKEGLERARKAAAAAGEMAEAKIFDQPFQSVLQTILSQKFPCLITPSSKDKFDELEKYLKTNYELRRFEFPKEITIDAEVKGYIENIQKRNQLRDLLENYPISPKTLEEFLAIYKTIDHKYLTEPAINIEKLRELVKHDTYKNNCQALKGIKEESVRLELLVTCLGNDPKDPEARGIATLASKLMAVDPQIKDTKYLWSIFDWESTLGIGAHKKWNFTTYIGELKKLNESRDNDDILPIIQAGWQEYLINKFDCLKGEDVMKPPSFDLLKEELDKNYDLTDITGFNFGKTVKQEVQDYVKFICERNSLKKLVEQEKQPDLDNFIKQYKLISSDNCNEALCEIALLKVLQLIKTDLGQEKALSCKKLLELDPKHRIALLESCFILSGEDEDNDHKKAVLIDKLLQIPGLFDQELHNHKNSKISGIIKDLNYEIYWAIAPGNKSTTDKPYYDLSHSQPRLQKILDRITIINDPSLSQIKNSLTAALNPDAPKLKEEPKPVQKEISQEKNENETFEDTFDNIKDLEEYNKSKK